jgi:hypothetical protein
MNRQQLLEKLDQAWAEIKESYAGLSGSQMTELGIAGDWSVKDILAHVTTWGEEALHHRGKEATTVHNVRRYRCLQCSEHGAETEPFAL